MKTTQVHKYIAVRLLSVSTNEAAIVGWRKATQALGLAARDDNVGAVRVPKLDEQAANAR
jgi:hypothetical protein